MRGEVIALIPKPSFRSFQLLITIESEAEIHKLMSLFSIEGISNEDYKEIHELLRKEVRRQGWN